MDDSSEALGLRERALARLAEVHDLEAVAREFGVPSDQLFAWVGDAVDHGRRLGAAVPRPRHSGPEGRPPFAEHPHVRERPPANKDMSTGDALLILLTSSGLFFSVNNSLLGPVSPSPGFYGVLPFLVAVLSLRPYAWVAPKRMREAEAAGENPAPWRRALAKFLIAIPCALAAAIASFGLLPILHALGGVPIEVHTVVVEKEALRSKSGECDRITTADFDPRLPAYHFCAPWNTYVGMHIGDALTIHGTTSWFGFRNKGQSLVPPTPATPTSPR